MAVQIVLALLALSSISFSSVSAEISNTPGNDFFHAVHPSNRNLLIKHFLTEALLIHSIYVSPDPRVADPVQCFGEPPRNFDNNLLYWTRTSLGLNLTQIAEAIEMNDINADEKSCSPGDIGCHCCPF